MIKDKIEKDKALGSYSLPSILVLDISWLGEVGRMPLRMRNVEELFTAATMSPWPTGFQAVLDGCMLSNLSGVPVVRSQLAVQAIEPLCWRDAASTTRVTGALIDVITVDSRAVPVVAAQANRPPRAP
jgi:hypothetical protein